MLVLKLLRSLFRFLSFAMHSFCLIGAGQGVFGFGIVPSFLLLQEGCDGIVIELEPGLCHAHLLIDAIVVRFELRRQLVFLDGLRIFLLGRRNFCQSKMGIGAIWIHLELLRKSLSRWLWTLLFQVSHAQVEVRPFILRVELNYTPEFAFRTREVALDPISARELVVCREVTRPLADRSLQL